ncbi:MAG: protocatechuate 4,5-dioxygenase subunit alpha [Candidatus Puniceispirillaceae bacterium]
MQERDYDDVPGTYVLDSRTYRRGYHLNMFLMTLNKADCRAEFAADEAAYLDRYKITDEQRAAVLERRYLDMLKLGANVYYTFKLVSHDRQPPQVMYGKMARPEMSFEEFQQMMISGGRSIDGNRSKKEQPDG